MNTLSTILVYGVPASLALSAIIFAMGRVNPRLMLRSYPKDVQAVVPPNTKEEKRQTLYWGIPFWLFLLGFPIASALTAYAAHQSFLEIFLSAFGVIFLFNLVDWLILDWLIVCTITPKFMVLPRDRRDGWIQKLCNAFQGIFDRYGSLRGACSHHRSHCFLCLAVLC